MILAEHLRDHWLLVRQHQKVIVVCCMCGHLFQDEDIDRLITSDGTHCVSSGLAQSFCTNSLNPELKTIMSVSLMPIRPLFEARNQQRRLQLEAMMKIMTPAASFYASSPPPKPFTLPKALPTDWFPGELPGTIVVKESKLTKLKKLCKRLF